MFRTWDHRAGHYLLLVALWALGCLPNLGGATLWDIDEGLNSEAAREMVQSGNYVVPTFNYKLRSAKPVLLYWLQAGSYHLFGVNETAARLPSALAALLAALATYELGRAMFGVRAALLAGVVLATSVSVLGAAHFANPDALLLAFSTLTLGCYYRYWQTGRFWWVYGAAVACGLAVLAKGPVGVLLPGAVVFLFLLWQRELGRVFDLHLGEALLIFLLVAAPWYAWVGVETKGQFLREFWFTHHLERVDTPMEKHGGSPFYYVVVLAAGLFPWSIFLGPTAAHAWRRLRQADDDRAAVRLLVLWFVVCFGVFTYARTKLPNYILPLYPAAALLTAWALERWRAGEFAVPGWVMGVSLGCLALAGAGTVATLLVFAGAVPAQVPFLFPDLLPWAWVGVLPVTGAAVGGWMLAQRRREAFLVAVTAASAGFIACVTAGVLPALNDHKASPALAGTLPADHEYREVRVGAYCYDRPSMVFYCRREVRRLDVPEQALDFLAGPLPSYVFVSEARWPELEEDLPDGSRVVARFPDLYGKGKRVLVVANRAAP
ncbi:MAG: glycosyltransferase family 39 protein [Gemmataceae bacterium]